MEQALAEGKQPSSCFVLWGGFYATLELNSREGKRFLGAEILRRKFHCPTKTLLAHFRKSAFGLSDKPKSAPSRTIMGSCGSACAVLCVAVLISTEIKQYSLTRDTTQENNRTDAQKHFNRHSRVI